MVFLFVVQILGQRKLYGFDDFIFLLYVIFFGHFHLINLICLQLFHHLRKIIYHYPIQTIFFVFDIVSSLHFSSDFLQISILNYPQLYLLLLKSFNKFFLYLYQIFEKLLRDPCPWVFLSNIYHFIILIINPIPHQNLEEYKIDL